MSEYDINQVCVSGQSVCVCVRPDGASGVAEDGGSEALSDADQAGPINLHYQVIHLDPTHTHKEYNV